MNCDLLFPAFVSSLFCIKHFQAKGQNLAQWKPPNRTSVYKANRLLSSFGWKKTILSFSSQILRWLEQVHRLLETFDVRQWSCCRLSNQKWAKTIKNRLVLLCWRGARVNSVHQNSYCATHYDKNSLLQNYSKFSIYNTVYSAHNENKVQYPVIDVCLWTPSAGVFNHFLAKYLRVIKQSTRTPRMLSVD